MLQMVEEGVSLGQGIAGVGGDPVGIPTNEAGRGGAAGWRCASSPLVVYSCRVEVVPKSADSFIFM